MSTSRERPGSDHRVRLVDVANAAGVSKSIASRVLNDYPDLAIRAETRARVLDAAQDLGYTPHAGALAVARSQTGAIAFLVPPLSNPVYVRIVRGAFDYALSHELVVLLIEDVDPVQADKVTSALIRSGRIDGLIMASAMPDHPLVHAMARTALPHVFVNRAVRDSHRNIVMADALASETAVDHFVALGHRRLGSVTGELTVDPAARRASAFRRRVNEQGLPPATYAAGNFTEAGGAAAAREILAKRHRPTAIFVHSLSQAIGVLAELRRSQVRVPEDMSVIAYDDMSIADYTDPPLTTIRMPLASLGAAAVQAVLDQMSGANPRDIVIEDRPELVIRDSTAPPP